MQKRLQLLIAMLVLVVSVAMAQVTTSGISGKVTSQGEEVIGATVTATHQPSGTVYRAVTNMDGRFSIQGMRPGGPYKVEVSYIGYQSKTFKDVSLNLGESQNLSCSLQEDARELQEVVVSGKAGLNGTKTGAAQSINAQQIAEMPSISHSIADIARMNAQVSTNGQSGAMSFAGTNNRYNSFQIDGVMNNDVFGLTQNGSNGGQAGSQPVSMETIEQIQINVAPFDVRQGGFTGGAINAVTKSGTNVFHGSAYFDGNNESLVGRHYKMQDGTMSNPYDKEKETRFGFTLGGPIIKNKLFFFANYENTNKSYPTQYSFGSEGAKFDSDLAQQILDAYKAWGKTDDGGNYEYNGTWANKDKSIKSQKGGLKLDWNINDFNKFSIRWSYVDAKQLLGLGGMASLNTADHLYEFASKTHSFAAELQSRLSPYTSNEARLSYVRVRDSRSSGAAAPSVTIYNVGNGTVNIGNEYSSMANSLDQDIFTFEDNFTWYRGNHTFTFGTHNEFYKFENLFIQNLYGCYYFDSPSDFFKYIDTKNGQLIKNFYYTTANKDVTGKSLWAPSFGAGQLGFYVQDKWDATNNFQLTYGLRMEIPLFFDTPTENKEFNDWATAAGYDYRTNQKLSSTPMWSPRVGFRWDIKNDHKYILRGGIGMFTGRIPFVWLSNSFTNTGVQFSSYSVKNNANVSLIVDPNKQDKNAELLKATGSQLVNVFDKNFKFAQNLRINLGFDFQALGIDWTAEAIFSKNLNDIYYQNIKKYDCENVQFKTVMTQKITNESNKIYSISLYDMNGNRVWNFGESSSGFDNQQSWFENAKKNTETTQYGHRHLVKSDLSGYVMDISRYVEYINAGNIRSGILLMQYYTESIEGILDRYQNQKSAYCYLTDESKSFIYHPFEKRIASGLYKEKTVTTAFKNNRSIHNGDWLVERKQIGYTGWNIVVVNSMSNLLVENRRFHYIIWFILLLVGAILILLDFQVFRNFTDPVYQLLATMEDFGKGNYNSRAKEEGIGELKSLSANFNIMADKLQEQMEEIRKYNYIRNILQERADSYHNFTGQRQRNGFN